MTAGLSGATGFPFFSSLHLNCVLLEMYEEKRDNSIIQVGNVELKTTTTGV